MNQEPRAFIHGNNVIATGTYVIQYGQVLDVFPFEDDFHFIIDIRIVDGETSAVFVEYSEEDQRKSIIVLEIAYPQSTIALTNRKPLLFSTTVDGNINHFINICAFLVGDRDAYTAQVSFSVYSLMVKHA